jgi:1-acyl-sn-glycerol-3-phosphate acyltransferase
MGSKPLGKANGMDIYYSTDKLIIKIYQLIFSQSSCINGELPLPPGPKIIAANHANVTDGFFLPFVSREKLHFFIQGDIFSVPFFGWLLKKSEQIPVFPDQKKAALEKASQLLSAGKTVVIFPEGRLNPDSQPIKAFTGAIRLSLITNAAIIPVGFHVPRHNLRNRSIKKGGRSTLGFWQTGGRCYIRIGGPWHPREAAPGAGIPAKVDENLLGELTTHLMDRIKSLVDQAALDYISENNQLVPNA